MTTEPAAISFEIITLFPELFDSFLAASLLGTAVTGGLVSVERTHLRDFGIGKHRLVDDTPYGGGPGMVLRPEPLAAAIQHVEAARGPCHRIVLSPQGRVFDQAAAARLAGTGRVMFVCGRYEGIDERVCTLFAHEVFSIGDFVLSGGEIAAAVMIEAITRLVPGVIGKCESTADESFGAGRLEYPHWTRPREFQGLGVPDVLMSGDHAAVDSFRRCESLRRTLLRRPDLLERVVPTDAERKVLDQLGPAPIDPFRSP